MNAHRLGVVAVAALAAVVGGCGPDSHAAPSTMLSSPAPVAGVFGCGDDAAIRAAGLDLATRIVSPRLDRPGISQCAVAGTVGPAAGEILNLTTDPPIYPDNHAFAGSWVGTIASTTVNGLPAYLSSPPSSKGLAGCDLFVRFGPTRAQFSLVGSHDQSVLCAQLRDMAAHFVPANGGR